MVRKPDPQKKAHYMNAALNLFVINGVQGTSTAAIAKEAGTAAGTLFLYFPTKQDLIHELVLDIGRQQSEFIKKRIDPTHSAEETFYRVWEGSINWFLENMEAYQYVLQVRDSGMISEDVALESEKFFDYYFEAIQKGLIEGSVKPYPIELIGGMLYQDIVAVMNLITRSSNPTQREKYIQTGFEIFWDGIKTPSE